MLLVKIDTGTSINHLVIHLATPQEMLKVTGDLSV